MAKLRMAHASTHGARKPPGPKLEKGCVFCNRSLFIAIYDFFLSSNRIVMKNKDFSEK